MAVIIINIINLNINDLLEYENNPRNNDRAVGPVAESIRQFGFKIPIIVDSQNVIIAGHTRLKAAKQLELETVPCIVADDLTEEQIKAFRLADNKVAEIADWDFDLLNIEMAGIKEFDMSDFGFEIDFDSDHEEKPAEKEHEDLSGSVAETYEVIVECDSELQQEEIYYRLMEEGLKCRILTL